ncbi:MAG: 3D domain-containing protein [Myxococcota bacterium]
MIHLLAAAWVGLLLVDAAAAGEEHTLVVTASAYNSTPGQTSGDPFVGAWGDRLEPGMRAIAVSRDLLALGLRRGARVEIEGLAGEYRVLDKMARRWRRKIDVYMGVDEKAARQWGVRQVRIRWKTD